MRALRISAWSLIAAAWVMAFTLPFRHVPDEGLVVVVFKPWQDHAAQLDTLVGAGLHLAGRPMPSVLVGYAPAGWQGADRLLGSGALVVAGADSFPLCTTRKPRDFV